MTAGRSEHNRLSKIECVLGTWMSQNASRDRRHTWVCLGLDRRFFRVSSCGSNPTNALDVGPWLPRKALGAVGGSPYPPRDGVAPVSRISRRCGDGPRCTNAGIRPPTRGLVEGCRRACGIRLRGRAATGRSIRRRSGAGYLKGYDSKPRGCAKMRTAARPPAPRLPQVRPGADHRRPARLRLQPLPRGL